MGGRKNGPSKWSSSVYHVPSSVSPGGCRGGRHPHSTSEALITEQGKMPPIKECVESDTAWRKRGQRTQHTEKLHRLSNKECADVLWSLELCAFLSPQRHSFGDCNLRFVPTEEPSAVSAQLPFLLVPQQQPRSINIHEHHSDKQQQQHDMTRSRWLTKGRGNGKDAGFGVTVSQLMKSKFNNEASDLEKWFSLTLSSLHSESCGDANITVLSKGFRDTTLPWLYKEVHSKFGCDGTHHGRHEQISMSFGSAWLTQ